MTDMTSMIALCPECDGYGQCLGEKAVVDYVNGGFYDEVLVECEECEGSGEIEQNGKP